MTAPRPPDCWRRGFGPDLDGRSLHCQPGSAVHHPTFTPKGRVLWRDNWATVSNAPNLNCGLRLKAELHHAAEPVLADAPRFPYINPSQGALEFARVSHPDLHEPSTWLCMPIAEPAAGSHCCKGHLVKDVGEPCCSTTRFGPKLVQRGSRTAQSPLQREWAFLFGA